MGGRVMRGVVVVQQLSVLCMWWWLCRRWMWCLCIIGAVGERVHVVRDGMRGVWGRDIWCLGEMPGTDACRYSRLKNYPIPSPALGKVTRRLDLDVDVDMDGCGS